MAKLTFLGLAERILKEEKKPLSPSEIWKIAVAKGYDKLLESEGKTPGASLYSVIFTNTRDNPETVFVKIGVRPARYFLKELVGVTKDLDKAIVAADDTGPDLYDYSEADLPYVPLDLGLILWQFPWGVNGRIHRAGARAAR